MKKLIFSLSVKAVTFVLLALCGIEIILNSSGVVITVLVGIIAVLSFPIASVLHESGHMLFGSFVKIKAIPDSKNFLSFILESLLDFGKPQSCKIIPKTDKKLRKALIVRRNCRKYAVYRFRHNRAVRACSSDGAVRAFACVVSFNRNERNAV